jgi:hypothetical protein
MSMGGDDLGGAGLGAPAPEGDDLGDLVLKWPVAPQLSNKPTKFIDQTA